MVLDGARWREAVLRDVEQPNEEHRAPAQERERSRHGQHNAWSNPCKRTEVDAESQRGHRQDGQ